jgi:hypothetical protein
MSSDIECVTENDLQEIVDRVLGRYPWMADYPVTCHASCARWDIAAEHGHDAGDAWEKYDTALWLLTGESAGTQQGR